MSSCCPRGRRAAARRRAERRGWHRDPPPQPIVVVVLQREQIEPVAGGHGVLEHADRRADVARPKAGEGNAAVVARREGFHVLVSRAAQPHQKNTFRAKSNAVLAGVERRPAKDAGLLEQVEWVIALYHLHGQIRVGAVGHQGGQVRLPLDADRGQEHRKHVVAPGKQQHRRGFLALERARRPRAQTCQHLQPAGSLGFGLDHRAQGVELGLHALHAGNRIALVHPIGRVEQDVDRQSLGLHGHALRDPRRLGG